MVSFIVFAFVNVYSPNLILIPRYLTALLRSTVRSVHVEHVYLTVNLTRSLKMANAPTAQIPALKDAYATLTVAPALMSYATTVQTQKFVNSVFQELRTLISVSARRDCSIMQQLVSVYRAVKTATCVVMEHQYVTSVRPDTMLMAR